MKRFYERFQFLEVLKNKVSTWTKKAKQYIQKNRIVLTDLLVNLIQIFVFGLFINMLYSFLFGFELSIIGIFGIGGTFYVLTEFISFLHEKNFVLFYDWRRK